MGRLAQLDARDEGWHKEVCHGQYGRYAHARLLLLDMEGSSSPSLSISSQHLTYFLYLDWKLLRHGDSLRTHVVVPAWPP